jgi:exonuclease SbcC
MKLGKLCLSNFGSYKDFEQDLSDQSLALVWGATGSGKSTLLDAPTWVLYGVTAKNGAADDVIAWGSSGATTGTLEVKLQDTTITVVRSRKPNDLYWIEGETTHRGKDLVETQKRLTARLGVTEEAFTLGSYYNEFSPAGSFFTAKASDRKKIMDSLVDLTFTNTLAEKASLKKKELSKSKDIAHSRYDKIAGKLDQLAEIQQNQDVKAKAWEADIIERVNQAKEAAQVLIQEKKDKIQFLVESIADAQKELTGLTSCEACGQPHKFFTDKTNEISMLKYRLKKETESTKNVYLEEQKRLLKLENPYKADHDEECEKLTHDKALVTSELASIYEEIGALETIQELSSGVRLTMIKDTVGRLEHQTNSYLQTHFDSEIKVEFKITSHDKLDVIVFKSGHVCPPTQLSKGQRGLLKLCFAVAVMEAASNKEGVHFDTLMFDEALDGMDSDLKLKAYDLFVELSERHGTVMVIDHNESLHHMFDKKYCVSMVGDVSKIEEL